MATAHTREWIQFFTGCGIPDDVAALYALIFYENRIQKNMLLDLNKEYLRDMGITVMGDVIAILRHAKIIHENYVREKIFSVDNSPLQDSVTNESTGVVAKKLTPMKRMLEHYTRKSNSGELESVSEVQVILPNTKIPSVSKKNTEKVGISTSLKKKIQLTPKPDLKEKGLEVPVPKVRRVLPENEGGYKIKMPAGTTERSKKLLEQAKRQKIKTVFDRLGESSVSSTTSEISTSTGSVNTLKSSSVFARLGEKTSAVSSTSSCDNSTLVSSNQLPYAGILKTNAYKKSMPNTTMRADVQQKTEVKKLNLKKSVSVKNRLGLLKDSSKVDSLDESTLMGAKATVLLSEIKDGLFKVSRNLNSINVAVKNNSKSSVISNKNLNNLRVETFSENPVIVTSTQSQNANIRNLKRKHEKLDNDSTLGSNPSKKVRFGRTTHRLIPPSPKSVEPLNYVKNYPKLTMTINNRSQCISKSSGLNTGSLNSDNMLPKLGVKDRIGSKSIQNRLGKRLGTPVTDEKPVKKKSRIQDRLG